MKILLLADSSSIHIIRWANTLAERGYTVHVATCHKNIGIFSNKVKLHFLNTYRPLCYYLSVYSLRALINKLQPDVFHAHYASGYGTLARLVKYRPLVLSVWGSDVYEFPYRSFWHLHVIRKNLQAADHVCSTSYAMARKVKKLGVDIKNLHVTPFGVDSKVFALRENVKKNVSDITIGTVKSLSNKYGIDILIRAFSTAKKLVSEKNSEMASRMRLLIVGGGEQHRELQSLVKKLKLEKLTTFVGPIPHSDVPKYLHKLDIYLALSRSESFGVAVLEASACELPVIVSDVGGLPEVVKDDVTGLIVASENVEQAAKAIVKLVLDIQLRKNLGTAGRVYVSEHYDWQLNVDQMEKIYSKIVDENV